MTSVAIIDDHLLLAEVVAQGLRSHDFDVEVIEVVDTLPSMVPIADVALVDLELGSASICGADLIEPLTASGAVVIILTGNEDRLVWARCIELGAAGVLSKKTGFTQLVDEVATSISSGKVGPSDSLRVELFRELAAHRRSQAGSAQPFEELTAREAEILKALMGGQTVADISGAQFVSVATVRTQVKAILRKLGVGSQLQAVALAYQVGWPVTTGTAEIEAQLRSSG